MKNDLSFLFLNNAISDLKSERKIFDEAVTTIKTSKDKDELKKSLSIISENSYYSTLLMNDNCGLKLIKEAADNLDETQDEILAPMIKNATHIQTSTLLDAAKRFGFNCEQITIIISGKLSEKPGTTIQPTIPDSGDNQDPVSMIDTAEYDAVLNMLQEYYELGDQAFLKDLDEGAIKDATLAFQMKKKQFDSFIDNKFNKMLEDYRAAKKKETQEQICQRSVKLSKIVTHMVLVFGAFAVNPAIGALTLIVPIIVSEKTKSYYQTQLINELATEERIVDEKIKDADSMGDKGKKDKIKLMRLKDKISYEKDQIERGFK